MHHRYMLNWSIFYAKFLTWRTGRLVISPYIDDGQNSEDEEQQPFRWEDTGEAVTSKIDVYGHVL